MKILHKPDLSKLSIDPRVEYIVVDLFAGAGGTTQAFERQPDLRPDGFNPFKVIVAINHDYDALTSHWKNHPDVYHFEEDMRTIDMNVLNTVVDKYRKIYPSAKLILWASLECTNFSNAKGGLPRDADSRTLAYSLYMKYSLKKKRHYKGKSYLQVLKPDFLKIENVREFMAWGELDENGKPVSRSKGKLWLKWCEDINKLGYVNEWKILNSADYGGFTKRKRLFGIFARSKDQIAWPKQTHAQHPEKLKTDLFSEPLQPWNAVKDCLDFSVEGNSIFGRKTPLKESTEKRILAGLEKHVAGGDTSYLLKYNSVNQKTGKSTMPGLYEPAPTVTTQNRLGVVKCVFLTNYNHSSKTNSIDEPSPTILTKDKLGYTGVEFLGQYFGKNRPIAITEPATTLTTKDRLCKVKAVFINSSFSGGGQTSSVNDPAPSVTTVPKQNITTINFLDQQYGNSKPASVDKPSGTITTNPKQALCHVKYWLLDTSYNNTGTSIKSPSPTVLANRKYHYLMNPQYNNKGGSINNPCFTLIARMDKMPPYLMEVEQGAFGIVVYEDDTPTMQKIKYFMAYYGICDIKMRMLLIMELLKIMGFPEDYYLHGTKAAMKKQIGNAVEYYVSSAWIKAFYHRNKATSSIINQKAA